MNIRVFPAMAALGLPAAPAVGGEVPDADVRAVVAGCNRFALELYARRATEEDGNFFFSPYSVSTALAMTYVGARGVTAEQMAQTLHFDLPPARLHPALSTLAGRLVRDEAAAQLRIANRLWGQEGEVFLDAFLDVCREQYGGAFHTVDFRASPETARRLINAWVAARTNDRIEELLKPEHVLNQPPLVLTNAIWFKGTWRWQFDPKLTSEAPFRISQGQTAEVPMMLQRGEFPYFENDTVQVLEMPYAGDRLSLVALLPKAVDGLALLEGDLRPEGLRRWLESLETKKVLVQLPRFRMSWQRELEEDLGAMGMPLAFRPGADFSGMNGERDLFIRHVVHEAFVEVNEEGTEAAAATAVVMGRSARPEPRFRADHPFLFLIRDRSTGTVLFLGRVVDPRDPAAG